MRPLQPAPVLLSLAVLHAFAWAVPAQEPPSYQGTAEVVAVDAVVDLGPGAAGRLPGGRRARAPETLEATIDGAPAPVVAVDGSGDRLERLVLYFDLALSDDHQVAWAAQRLGDRARELVRRGPVEVVAAAPVPVTTLAPTRDVAALEEALGRLEFLSEPSDELIELRLRSGSAGAPEPSPRERALVRERLDALLLALVDRSRPPDGLEEAAPRRAVLLATGGFDLAGFEPDVEETGHALAAYGWRVVPVLAPERRGLRPGKRIGKWRIAGLGATREEDRDPERAEAYLELAKALRGQGQTERAAEAAEDAAFHFYGDPRTAEREAEALALAAELHGELGDPQRARRALRKALRIDPGRLAEHPVTAAVPAAEEALSALADGARVVRDEVALRQALDALGDRAVVTVQAPVDAAADGIGRLVLRTTGAGREVAAGWVRLGTPAVVSAARARTGSAGDPPSD